jgi:class 3 adenylate cyclase/tetratricopeptide (TPR) repeat protein
VVTVLFADLVGFTARAEQMDVEDVRHLLVRFYDRACTEIERFGGTVDNFIGDAVMALFGAPVTHEDDPERAVHAAIAVLDAVSELKVGEPHLDLHLRVAVHTGEALVTVAVRPEFRESMAAGDVVNTAARLQAAAPVDGILVGAATYAATSRAIEYEPVDPVVAKGKSEPLLAWRVVGPRSGAGLAVAEAVRVPLVGRRSELRLLADALSRARADRTPKFVALIGVPGIGKSRLVAELMRIGDADSQLVVWRQGRSLPYGGGALSSLADMVRAQAGILADDSADAATRKLHDAVVALIDADSEVDWVEEHLRPLVGLAGRSRTAPESSFPAWRRFFEAMAEQHPTVLVFEDAHWADEALLDFVDYLIERTTGVPLLVIAATRPELIESRPAWDGGKLKSVTVPVGPLSDAHTSRLLSALLKRAAMPAERRRALVQQVAGNPLYAEEYARMMLHQEDLSPTSTPRDQPDTNLPLPPTVQGIVAARVDALPFRTKQALCDAAVIGAVAWHGAIAVVGEHDHDELSESLHILERREFLRRECPSTVAGELQYAFRHILLREVCYELIPRKDRADKHCRAARWLEELSTDRAADQAELVADHYLAAVRFSRGTDPESLAELTSRARYALVDAGRQAFALQAFAAAGRRFGAALELCAATDPERGRLLVSWARARRRVGFITADELQRAIAEALAVDDRESAAQLEAFLGYLFYERGQSGRGRTHDHRAVELVADQPPSQAKAAVLANLAGTLMTLGSDQPAIKTGSEALEMATALSLPEIANDARRSIGMARLHLGDPVGLADLDEALAAAKVTNSPYKTAEAYYTLAEARLSLGQLPAAAEDATQAREIAERFGIATVRGFLQRLRVCQLYWAGAWRQAVEAAGQLCAETGNGHYMDPLVYAVRARIRLGTGRVAEAIGDVTRGLHIAEESGETEILWPALSAAARALTAAGRCDEAQRHVEKLCTAVHDRAAPLLTGEEWWAADLAVLSVDLDVASSIPHARTASLPRPWLAAARAFVEGNFVAAASRYDDIGSVPDAALARLRHAENLLRCGRTERNSSELARLVDTFRTMGAPAYASRAEDVLAVIA